MFRLILAVFLVTAAFPAFAASFDCAKASHVVEKVICADADLSRMDEELAAVYRDRLAVMLDKLTFKGVQKDWLKVLRATCKDAECVRNMYVEQLSNYERAQGEDFSYNYKTSDETTVSVSGQSPEGFDFFIEKSNIDTGESLCRLPLLEGDGLLKAKYTKQGEAVWESAAPACKIIFHIVEAGEPPLTYLDLKVDGCDKMCGDYSIEAARYERSNLPVAGNQ